MGDPAVLHDETTVSLRKQGLFGRDITIVQHDGSAEAAAQAEAVFTSLEGAFCELHAKGIGFLDLDGGLAIANGHAVELGVCALAYAAGHQKAVVVSIDEN